MKSTVYGWLCIFFLILGYVIYCPSTFKWKEEVLLHDGRKIIVERKDVMGGWAEPGQSGSTQQRIITFSDPDHPKKNTPTKLWGAAIICCWILKRVCLG